MIRNIFKSQWIIFFLFLLSGGLLSIVLKFELLWDFANYHYFNPWAFWNDKVGFDAAVAGINAFFNPLPDLPLYFLIEYFNDYPNLIYFIQGLWTGLLAFLLYKTAALFFDKNTKIGRYSLVASILIGMSGFAVFFQIGTSSNEIMVSCFIMLSMWLLLREIFFLKCERRIIFFLAGLFAGIALGLKLTTFIYAIPLGITLILFYRYFSKPLVNIVLFACGGFLGFVLFDGFWLWKMWQMFENPFFPFGNKFFRSEYYEIRNYTDDRFLPKSFWEYLFLPFYWAANQHRAEGNMVVIDWRWSILYVWALLAVGKSFVKKVRVSRPVAFLSVFMVLSYTCWITVFAIARYMVVLELCGAILVVLAVVYLIPTSRKAQTFYWQVVSGLCFIALLTPVYSEKWGCRNCKLDNNLFKQFVAVQGVKIPDNTLLMFYNYPSAALLPYFARETKNIRGVSIKQQSFLTVDEEHDVFNENPKWQKLKAEIIHNHQGLKVGIIAVETRDVIKKMLTEEPYLKGMYCWARRSNIIPLYYFCISPDKKGEIFTNE